ncbi:MAG: D-alanine--D-alanine ligase [Bacteroidales bacterium]
MSKNIAIIAGGNSSEFPVSMNSAKTLEQALQNTEYKVFKIILSGTSWKLHWKNKDYEINKNDFSVNINRKTIHFDCALIIIHGTPGENGLLQGYFETLNIPYSTSGVLTSSLTFNKQFSKNYITRYGIPVSRFKVIRKNQPYDTKEILKETGLPCFVKPNKGGSSFGITKVFKENELEQAIEKAFEEDYEVLAEEYLEGTELTCGLIKTPEKEYIFPSTEIVSKNEFFDYEAKYTKGMADEITPARISEELENTIRKLSSKIYDIFDCRGIVRIDYIYSNGQLYFIELNTIPGMSAASIVPQQIEAAGYTLQEMLIISIENAIKNNKKEGVGS